MRIGIEVSQLTIGTRRWIFEYPPSTYGPLLDNCWLKTTWLYVSSRQLQIHASYPILNYVRQNDSFIMEKMTTLGLTENELVRVNRCRLYLQVILLSDIVDAGGIHILSSYLQGRRSTTRKSNLKWPKQGKPSVHDWKLWETSLQRAYSNIGSTRLQHSLGAWTAKPHQTWTWFKDIITNYVYKRCNNFYERYIVDTSMNLTTRTSGTWYIKVDIQHNVQHRFLYPCTTCRHTRRHTLLVSENFDDHTDVPPFTHPHTNHTQTFMPLLTYSDSDQGRRLNSILVNTLARLVGDGSYDKSTDIGSAAAILESYDMSSRALNAAIVPSNAPIPETRQNDPYRCELYAILLGLQMIYDLEKGLPPHTTASSYRSTMTLHYNNP